MSCSLSAVGNRGDGGKVLDEFKVTLRDHSSSRAHLCGDTGTDEAVKKIASNMRRCVTQHRLCKQIISLNRASLPARLIRITQDRSRHGPNEYSVQLTEQFHADTQYVCLSHCWGPSQFTCTTKSTFGDFSKEIEWVALAQTFQEAISFTFRLGFEHIWIDSLCICQDDALDWRHEGSKMDSIYAGACLTLAATNSSSANQGMFVSGVPHASRPLHKDQDHWLSQHYVYDRFHHVDSDSKVLPLTRRAWTLQERLLSIRIAHFGPTELLWECMESTWCECEDWTRWDSALMRTRQWLHGSDDVFGEPEQMHDSQLWHEVVQDYTRRDLTYQKDVFPALQGIAKRLCAKTSAVYYAGLWDRTFIVDLLWSVENLPRPNRPQKWRAPTWSWASVVGAVSWDAISFRQASTVLLCSTIPVGDDYFGELQEASLSLRGRCLKATLVLRLPEPGVDKTHQTFQLSLTLQYSAAVLPMDCQIDYTIPVPSSAILRFASVRTACDGCLLRDVRSPCPEHAMPSEDDIVPGFEDVLVMYVAHCSLNTRRYFLALRCVNVVTQQYERIGLAKAPWNVSVFENYDQYLEQTERIVTVV